MAKNKGSGAKRTSDAAEHDFPKRPRLEKKTDVTRWRCKDDEGRLTWHYLADDKAAKEWPQTYADKYYLGLPLVRFQDLYIPPPLGHALLARRANTPCQDLPSLPRATNPLDAARNGLEFFEKLQLPSGTWGCEYGGPMFLIPGIVITWYVTKTPIPSHYATEIRNYLFARAHPEDGGWGLHIEGESSVFGTAMNYVVLRLIGVDAEDPVMVKARGTLHKLGGALNGPHWAKFWLAVLGVADWDLVNPVPPEIWLMPDWVPIAPWRWWIHMRQVFLPMSYIYSKRWTCEETDLVRELRNEVFVQPWAEINWASHRNTISDMDNYHPKSWLLNTVNWFLYNVYPYFRPNWIKNRAEAWTSELVDMEDANTDYADLAPVNAPMNTIVCYIRDGPGAYSVRRHIERFEEFLWVKNEGMLCNGTNGVQCWDTAFTIQAAMEAGVEKEDRWRPMLTRALGFLDTQQIREDCVDQDKCYRQQRKGGWPFSNKDQGYAVSDCISEALKSVILLQKTEGYPTLLDEKRILEAIDTLLIYQNDDTGGVSSYEKRRGGEHLEMLNAAEVFGRIMVEYDYPECTTACVTALSLFREHWPDYRASEIQNFIDRAANWIKSNQRVDGSWYGNWGVCFTYAAMFALESMKSIGETYGNSFISKSGCDFLISKQREDGGWSESYKVGISFPPPVDIIS